MRSYIILLLFFLGIIAPVVLGSESSAGTRDTVVPSPPASTVSERRDAQAFFDETFNDLQQELEITAEEGKVGLLIMFEMDECPFCRRMKQTALNRSEVQDYFRANFRIISVDIEGDLELIDFSGTETTQKVFALKQHRVRATPVFLFFGLDGEPLKNGRLTGATKDAAEFLLWGRYIVEKHNDTQSFSRFKRKLVQRAANEEKG